MKFEHGLLIMLHCEQHTGYAIGVLEKVFSDAANKAGYLSSQIFWSFSEIHDGSDANVIACHYKSSIHHKELELFVRRHNIRQVLAFDLGYPASVISVLRRAGVKNLITYWGASMSSLNSGIKLLLKRFEWYVRRDTPDYFIFESDAMRRTAIEGRGVPAKYTSVVPLGVDTEAFFPKYGEYFYAHDSLGIPRDHKIVFYSGHMEERKGVRVIMQAAIELFRAYPSLPVHFVVCGNKPGEELPYLRLLENDFAQTRVIFAGYRNDIAHLMRSSYVGVIASIGWDSFTMSSVEMMASGLPMIVSKLQGLTETIEDGGNGYFITPGDSKSLAELINVFVTNDQKSLDFSKASRLRAINVFSRQIQVGRIASELIGACSFS